MPEFTQEELQLLGQALFYHHHRHLNFLNAISQKSYRTRNGDAVTRADMTAEFVKERTIAKLRDKLEQALQAAAK